MMMDAAHDVEDLTRLATQHRRQIVENLSQTRKNDVAYLRDLHLDPQNGYFLNIAQLGEDTLNFSTILTRENHQERCEQLYFLGLSLGRLLTTTSSASQLVVDGCQLMDELDFYFAPSGIQNMKLMTVATKSPLYERGDRPSKELTEPYRSVIRKWNNKPVYQRLMTPNIAFPLDYCHLVVSLCEMLTLLYGKLINDDACVVNPHVFHALLRLDDKLKKFLLDNVNKHLSSAASELIKSEFASLRPQRE
ncbi:hypothetical protein LEN26_019412 [Aphanomyces euteiches]|nr:hypothetical protein LEN26_019412 [Aphanomyces euteiches]KAH9128483.1 hypothetical protein AeMF1_001367 [Aphanomyces euteiches]